MLSVSDALKLISEHTPKPKIQRVPVDMALGGSVLAEDVIATESVPAFRASIVDGYAVSLYQDIWDISTASHVVPTKKLPLRNATAVFL